MSSAVLFLMERVLFVDDPRATQIASRLLPGFDVASAHSASEALDLLSDFRPSVVVAAADLRPVTGVDFLVRVRDVDPDVVRILATSAAGEDDDTTRIVNECEVWRLLEKPWREREFRETLEEAAAEHQSHMRDRLRMDRLAALGTLAAGVVHELNNPMAVISAYAQCLLQATPRSRHLLEVEREVERCSSTLRALLDFARAPGACGSRTPTDATVLQAVGLLQIAGASDPDMQLDGGSVAMESGRLLQLLVGLLARIQPAAIETTTESCADRVRILLHDGHAPAEEPFVSLAERVALDEGGELESRPGGGWMLSLPCA